MWKTTPHKKKQVQDLVFRMGKASMTEVIEEAIDALERELNAKGL